MAMKVKEVAALVGISVRTLHHYDDVGLLKPDHLTESGYRLYSEENLEMLQQILFFKELGFPLRKIKNIVMSPSFDRQEALEMHKRMLIDKRGRIDQMISTIDKTIHHMKGDRQMTNEEKFVGFDFDQNPYEQEARERWGNDAVDASQKNLAKLSKQQQTSLSKEWEALYTRLATLRHASPDSEEAQEAIKEWYDLLNSNFGHYTLDAFKGLGQLYVDDERFTKNIDKYGEGLAIFMRDAMGIFADANKELI